MSMCFLCCLVMSLVLLCCHTNQEVYQVMFSQVHQRTNREVYRVEVFGSRDFRSHPPTSLISLDPLLFWPFCWSLFTLLIFLASHVCAACTVLFVAIVSFGSFLPLLGSCLPLCLCALWAPWPLLWLLWELHGLNLITLKVWNDMNLVKDSGSVFERSKHLPNALGRQINERPKRNNFKVRALHCTAVSRSHFCGFLVVFVALPSWLCLFIGSVCITFVHM